jgi:catechol 2,3-dioxygenase-like lactoylglutathione lyase family enzyme
MKITLEHVGLPAADAAAQAQWYERVFGAQRLWDNGQTPPTCRLALGDGAWVEIYPANAETNAARGDNKLAGFRHLALRVDSLAAAKTELAEHGVNFTEEIRPAAGGGSVLFFADPEGNWLHLVERLPDGLVERPGLCR